MDHGLIMSSQLLFLDGIGLKPTATDRLSLQDKARAEMRCVVLPVNAEVAE